MPLSDREWYRRIWSARQGLPSRHHSAAAHSRPAAATPAPRPRQAQKKLLNGKRLLGALVAIGAAIVVMEFTGWEEWLQLRESAMDRVSLAVSPGPTPDVPATIEVQVLQRIFGDPTAAPTPATEELPAAEAQPQAAPTPLPAPAELPKTPTPLPAAVRPMSPTPVPTPTWTKTRVIYEMGSGTISREQAADMLGIEIPPTPLPTSTPAPTPLPTFTPTPAPTPPPPVDLYDMMLDLINEERVKAGVTPVRLGTNRAAQIHADASLRHCFSSHWGIDGLKPYMRYSLAGGYQSNGENGSGRDYCVVSSDGYATLGSLSSEVARTMKGWMQSPGHRRNILDPTHRMVNLGMAWDKYNFLAYQHFEGDYVEYLALPELKDGRLSLVVKTKNGARFGEGNFFPIKVSYDPPPHQLTRGQVSRTYCYSRGRPVAFVEMPPPPGSYYTEHSLTTSHQPCPDPYDVPADAAPPASSSEARRFWADAVAQSHDLAKISLRVPMVVASTWSSKGGEFSVEADLGRVVEEHGPGVYTVMLWGMLSGKAEIISEYSIFEGTERPTGYGD